MTDFIFVHGGCHDGWCWHLVQSELENRGHRSWAPDLPIEDEQAGLKQYADGIVAATHEAAGNAIVVGHSLGGLVIPIIATMRPVEKIVFLDAPIPVPGRPFKDQWTDPEMRLTSAQRVMEDVDEKGRIRCTDRQAVIDAFYHDCPPDLVDEAIRHLRPQSMKPFVENSPLESWPDVEMRFVHNRHDRCSGFDFHVKTVRDRFGQRVIEMPGGHSPFLARPIELAEALGNIASDSDSVMETA